MVCQVHDKLRVTDKHRCDPANWDWHYIIKQKDKTNQRSYPWSSKYLTICSLCPVSLRIAIESALKVKQSSVIIQVIKSIKREFITTLIGANF